MDAIFDFFFKSNVFVKIAMFLWTILVAWIMNEEIQTFSSSKITEKKTQQEIVVMNKDYGINSLTSRIDKK